MFDHVKFGVSDYAASKAFFLKALEPLGVAVVSEGPPTYGVELSPPEGKASLCLYQTEAKPAHPHLAFTAKNRQQVEAFHRAALEAGGKDNGAPGLRPHYHANYYAAFVNWSGRAQHRSGLPRTSRLTLPSRGRPQAGFAHLRPPLMSNGRQHRNQRGGIVRNLFANGLFVVWSLTRLLFLAAVPVIAATMPAVKMKVVDERQGTPIPGLVALFWGTAREGTITGHGGKHAILFAVKAVSGESGDLRFPKQDFNGRPFFLNTNYENPSMLLLKPGYAPLVLHNQLRIVPRLAEASRWEYEGKTVKMTKATGDLMRQQAHLITTYTDMMLGFEGGCTWKRVPRALVVADRMFPNPGKTNTLRTLFMNDALFVQRGCGSPKAFFEPYLRP